MVAVLFRIIYPLLRYLPGLAHQEPDYDPSRGLGLGAERQDADAGWHAPVVARRQVGGGQGGRGKERRSQRIQRDVLVRAIFVLYAVVDSRIFFIA